MKYNNLDNLIKDLEEIFTYFVDIADFNIKGYSDEDLKQELRLHVIELWNTKNLKDKGKGWWFMCCKWRLLNMVKESKREPLNKSISLYKFLLDKYSKE